jgi:hypothetical protein
MTGLAGTSGSGAGRPLRLIGRARSTAPREGTVRR